MESVLFGGMATPTPYDELFEENLDQRIIVINDEITDMLINNTMLFILKWNREDIDLPRKKETKDQVVY